MAERPKQTANTRTIMGDLASQPIDLRSLNCEELAWRSQQGCRAAFAELISRYGSRLLQFLSYRTSNVHDAEDLVQDTFVRAYTNIHLYRDDWKFSTWLFTIARRLAASRYSKRKSLCIIDEPSSDVQCPSQVVAADEDRQNLWTLARELPNNQFRALWLKYSEGMSIKQIAKVLGKSQVCTKVLLYRARVTLAERLKAADDNLAELYRRPDKNIENEV